MVETTKCYGCVYFENIDPEKVCYHPVLSANATTETKGKILKSSKTPNWCPIKKIAWDIVCKNKF